MSMWIFFVNIRRNCSRTLLVQQRERERERAIVGVSCGQFGTVSLKFHCQLHFGEPLDTEIVERERRLAADKGAGRPTLAVE
jgi:hypothetical protein